MKEVISLLRKLGLSSTEINLYLNGLGFRKVNVATLVKKSRVKRTTAYHALDTLSDKGLVTSSKEDGKLFYSMTPPAQLEKVLLAKQDQLSEQVKQLQAAIPLFPTPSSDSYDLPDVSNYSGIDGVHMAIDKALYCKSRSWRIISPKDNYFKRSSSEYIAYFKNKRQERGISSKSLWESRPSDVDYHDAKTRYPRIMPDSMVGKFKSTIIIFDDKALIISSYRQQFATLISSKEAAQTLALMFDVIWDISQNIRTK